MSDEQSLPLSDFYYLFKPTDTDYAKRIKSRKIRRNTKPNPKCAICSRHCNSFDFVKPTQKNKSLKKCKRGRCKFMINNKYFEKMITRENDDDIVSTKLYL